MLISLDHHMVIDMLHFHFGRYPIDDVFSSILRRGCVSAKTKSSHSVAYYGGSWASCVLFQLILYNIRCVP